MATLVETKDGVISAPGRVSLLPPVATLATLAATPVYGLTNGIGALVLGQEDYYIWIATSTHTPDGASVILPASYNPTTPSMGRWVREIEKALPDGVATLDSDGVLEQAAKKVYAQSETLTWDALADGMPVVRSGPTIASGVLTQAVTASTTDIPSAAAVKTFVEAQASAGGALTVVSKTADYTVLATDSVIYGDPGSQATITITLPQPSTVGSGKEYRVKHIGTSNSVIVDTSGGNIDGNSAGETLTPLESTTVVCDGTDYWIH